MNILTVSQLGMAYAGSSVLQDITFAIPAGQILGVLGPNGAGKSTLTKLISGLIQPTSGQISILGQSPAKRSSKQVLGLVPQETKLPEDLTSLELAQFVSSQFPAGPLAARTTSRSYCLEHLASWEIDFAHKPLRSLSGGQKHRVSLALAYLGQPRLILLDEPTTGLDTASRRLIWQTIKKHSQQGVATLLTSHYLDEVELLADQILLLDRGRNKGYLPKEDFLRVSQSTVVECTVDQPHLVENLPSVSSVHQDASAQADGQVKVTVSDIAAFLRELVASSVKITAFQAQAMSLEQAMETRLQEKKTPQTTASREAKND